MRRKASGVVLGALLLCGLFTATAGASVVVKWNSDCMLWFMISWEGYQNGELQNGSLTTRVNSETTLPLRRLTGIWIMRNDAGQNQGTYEGCPQATACRYYNLNQPARSQVQVTITKEGGIVISFDGNVVQTCY